MSLVRDTFCSYCGTAYAPPLTYPRACTHCKTPVWANPIPVSVVLVPVTEGGRTGLLVVRRGILPGKDKLALAGGFLEEHETWAQGRRARDPRGDRGEGGCRWPHAVLVHLDGATPQPRAALLGGPPRWSARRSGPSRQNAETSERGLVFGPDGLDEVFAFPLHVKAARRFFSERGLKGAHDYVQV